MATNWGSVILGGGALLGIAYVFFNWKTICPQVLGAQQCAGGLPGLFGGTIIGSGIAQGYGQVYTDPTTGVKTQIDPQKTVVGAPAAKVTTKATIPKKPRLQASGSASIGAGAGAAGHSAYTSANSFNTITLNRLSVR